ncbi:cobalamin trafficking protein CblD-like [Apostichopus japonicus]|uniref:cobalamin trafficking protein CblD-like n=1 Tax=Stichopus japonicus TaxID=307972 RepID=UPI003AB599E1
MAKLLARAKVVSFLPGLRNLRYSVAARRTFNNSSTQKQCTDSTDGSLSESMTVWPDPKLGLLGPKDPRFPLPGNVGLAGQLQGTPTHPFIASNWEPLPDLLTKPLPQDRHLAIFTQFLNSVSEISEDCEIEDLYNKLKEHREVVECIAQDCPPNLRKDCKDLFPDCELKERDIVTVMTLCQRTVEDMSAWSPDVETERDELLDHFIGSAEDICKVLTSAGYWADFIDPSSGQAFIGSSNPSTSLFETDERFKQLGFDIEDLGCCKCVRHTVWGTHAFVGAIFTTAPADSEIIKELLTRDFKAQTEQE